MTCMMVAFHRVTKVSAFSYRFTPSHTIMGRWWCECLPELPPWRTYSPCVFFLNLTDNILAGGITVIDPRLAQASEQFSVHRESVTDL